MRSAHTIMNVHCVLNRADGCEKGRGPVGSVTVSVAGAGTSNPGLPCLQAPQTLHMVTFTVIFTRWAFTACSFLYIPPNHRAVFQKVPEGIEFKITA